MNIFISISIGVCLVIQIFCMYLLIRNNKVVRYREMLLRKISEKSKRDIADGKLDGWLWRYHVYESVSYSQMLYMFWRKFDDFYPDKSFIE